MIIRGVRRIFFEGGVSKLDAGLNAAPALKIVSIFHSWGRGILLTH